ncbi:TPA: DNA-directed RNA polymerase subunit alpha [Candidatus Gracilibacteria bacterium]|nr:DNA-directed RNA polymerase subunit alpha [Candidatus Peregrinibacteria bacterium]HIQ56992.1 DNA-directed RNA polymerase subunit alpha [Candidatus Gracilibacteria bacterium]HIQ57423.1 DNA-directed RNA polymerase subunit alpha [Candidatus Gracilibacteria bacterium]
MHIVQEEIGKPKITEEKISDNQSIFRFSPLPSGFGHTLGNAMRRTLLSSVPGAGITKVRIKGVAHEYTSLPGVRDSILNVLLNLKQVSFKKHTKYPEVVTLVKKTEGDILASEFITEGDTEVLNGDYKISSITESSIVFDLEAQLEKGIGFSSAKERLQKDGENSWILLDTIFSPVTSVQYEVLPARVGDMTNLDTLQLNVLTNGSLSPADAFQFSAQILEGYFSFLQNETEEKIEEGFLTDFSSVDSLEENLDDQESYTPIEILNLSPRTLNALINGNIGSVEEVMVSSASHLESMRGFGKKAMSELTEALEANGYESTLRA